MTVLNRNPQNTNPLQPTKFLMTFTRVPSTTYFCQSVSIPSISLGSAMFPTPTLDVNVPGNKLTFGSLTVTFIVNEDLESWKNIYDWLMSIGHPNLEERERLNRLAGGKRQADATLTVLSALNNPVARVQFIGLYPTDIADINFDTTLSADTIITATATFNYMYYEFLPL